MEIVNIFFYNSSNKERLTKDFHRRQQCLYSQHF